MGAVPSRRTRTGPLELSDPSSERRSAEQRTAPASARTTAGRLSCRPPPRSGNRHVSARAGPAASRHAGSSLGHFSRSGRCAPDRPEPACRRRGSQRVPRRASRCRESAGRTAKESSCDQRAPPPSLAGLLQAPVGEPPHGQPTWMRDRGLGRNVRKQSASIRLMLGPDCEDGGGLAACIQIFAGAC